MVALHLRHAGAHAVAGKAAAHEDDVAVQPRDAVAAVRERLDIELDDVVTLDGSGHLPRVAAPVPRTALRGRRRPERRRAG